MCVCQRASSVHVPVPSGHAFSMTDPYAGDVMVTSMETAHRSRSNMDRVRLVLADSDGAYRAVVAVKLGHHGVDVVGLPDGQALLRHFAGDAGADIIGLEWMLPDVSGMDMLARLRHRGVRVPVIFLTIDASARRESQALGRGAIDFVAKSRGLDILAQRVHRIARLVDLVPAAPQEMVLRFGLLQMKPQVCRAYWQGVDLNLTMNEFKVVRLLTSRTEEYVSPRDIYDCMHYAGFIGGTGEEGYRTNVRSAIRRIRRKFQALDPGFDAIATLAVEGYQWRGSPPRRPVDRAASWHDQAAGGISDSL